MFARAVRRRKAPSGGATGLALEFDGGNDSVMTSAQGFAGEDQSFSVAVWLNGSGPTSVNRFVVSNYAGSYSRTAFFALGSDSSSSGMFFWLRDTGRNTVAKTAYHQPAFDGLLHHYLGVRDIAAGQVRFYIDGVLKETVSTANTHAVEDAGAPVGLMLHQDDKYLAGVLDDARIYTRALSDAEAQTLYGARNGDVLTSDLFAWWRFDEGAADQVAAGPVLDSSGNGYHGTPSGGPIYREVI